MKRRVRYVKHWAPNSPPQMRLLSTRVRECLIGGAPGSGKTAGALALPCYWLYHPSFKGLYIRRTEKRLTETIEEARKFYEPIGCTWEASNMQLRFPGNGTFRFGYANRASDVEKYKTDTFTYIFFDELSEFEESAYLFLFQRNRSSDDTIPCIVRAGTNPSGPGIAWVNDRFVEGREPGKVYTEEYTFDRDGEEVTEEVTRLYIQTTIFDNPAIANPGQYLAGMADYYKNDLGVGEENVIPKQVLNAIAVGDWRFFVGTRFKEQPQVVPATKLPFKHYVARSMDYGVNITALHWAYVYPSQPGLEKPRIDLFRELTLRNEDPDGIVKMVRLQEQQDDVQHVNYSVADPSIGNREGTSMTSMLDMLDVRGLWFERGDNARIPGWILMDNLIMLGILCVWEGRCPELMRTLPQLMRKEGEGDARMDVQKSRFDHWAEGVRYMLRALPILGDFKVPDEEPQVQPLRPQRRDPRMEREERGESIVGPGMDDYFDMIGSGW